MKCHQAWFGAAIAVALVMLSGCESARSAPPARAIDLRTVAPVGVDVCKGKGVKMNRVGETTLVFPENFEVDMANYPTVKKIAMREGSHAVDLYQDLQSERLRYTRAELKIVDGVRAIRANLNADELPPGSYVVGVSGDPFSVYCSVSME